MEEVEDNPTQPSFRGTEGPDHVTWKDISVAFLLSVESEVSQKRRLNELVSSGLLPRLYLSLGSGGQDIQLSECEVGVVGVVIGSLQDSKYRVIHNALRAGQQVSVQYRFTNVTDMKNGRFSISIVSNLSLACIRELEQCLMKRYSKFVGMSPLSIVGSRVRNTPPDSVTEKSYDKAVLMRAAKRKRVQNPRELPKLTEKKSKILVNPPVAPALQEGSKPILISDSPVSSCSQDVWFQIGSIKLTFESRCSLLNNAWLDDLEIVAMQTLISNHFRHIKPPLSPVLQGRKRTLEHSVIQIVHVEANHWVVVSNIRSGRVCDLILYDTMGLPLTEGRLQILRNMYGSGVGVTNAKVPQQFGGDYCGDYCCAIFIELASGNDPTKITFNYKSMRAHLIQCLDTNTVSHFPRL